MNQAATKSKAKVKVGPESRHCAEGNHSRCLGTVYDAKGLVPCGCPVGACGHGPESKAKR